MEYAMYFVLEVASYLGNSVETLIYSYQSDKLETLTSKKKHL